MRKIAMLLVALWTAPSLPAAAEQINVTHWGEIMLGVPYAVALEKGYFKEAGVDITGIISAKGGGTTVRNIMASELPYGEVAPSAAIAAIKSGLPIKIVNGSVRTISDFVLVVRPDSDIKSLKDVVGKKWGLTSAKSNTDILSAMMLEKAGIPRDSVQRPAIGNQAAVLQAIENDSVQIGFILEPMWTKVSSRMRSIGRASDVLPPMLQTVGIASTDVIKAQPAKIRAIIAGRRKGVEFALKNPAEAADILVKYYEGLDPKIAREVVAALAKENYWSPGDIEMTALQQTVHGLELVGEVEKGFDLAPIIDTSMLPTDLQAKSN